MLYTVEEAAEYLHCSTRRIYYLVTYNRLTPSHRRPLRFTLHELQRLANDPKRIKAYKEHYRRTLRTSNRQRESTRFSTY